MNSHSDSCVLTDFTLICLCSVDGISCIESHCLDLAYPPLLKIQDGRNVSEAAITRYNAVRHPLRWVHDVEIIATFGRRNRVCLSSRSRK